jgi:hypothetical protein
VQDKGMTVDDPELLRHLEPLPPEGFYRVIEAFHCCEQRCRAFEPEMLVVLGYNGSGQAILFAPELVDGLLAVPETGTAIDHARLQQLKQLKVALEAHAQHAHHAQHSMH